MTGEARLARTEAADALCRDAFVAAGCPSEGVVLLAVGGFGRRELAPYSDLDVVLVHEGEVGEWAGQVWYPLWDSGVRLDHAVRSVDGVLEQARADLRVALGLLNMRCLAGDTGLALRLRSAVLTQWRRDARSRLGELRDLNEGRGSRHGELAHIAVPDVKESAGGLRDATVLHGLAAAWLVDVPHTDLERSRLALLDVRDELHAVAGRATDRIAPEYWPELAEALGLPDALAAQRHVRGIARRVSHLSRLAWQRADAALRSPSRDRRPQLDPIGPGIALSRGEVVLTRDARVATDPLLLLRAAAEAARRGCALAPSTAARLATAAPSLPEPWPRTARDLLVRLLGAGPGLVAVWETLEETGAVARLLPEWEKVRLLPHASTVHRFTVDRHLVETCVVAAELVRRVARPDLLLVAALLHDIGKGSEGDHSLTGAPIAQCVGVRWGFGPEDVATIGLLVHHHLLLPTLAMSRDPDDPATRSAVIDVVGDPATLDLLTALTEADARATSDKAWSPWRAAMIRELLDRTTFPGESAPELARDEAWEETQAGTLQGTRWVLVDGTPGAARLRVIGPDRAGLLADIAATLASARFDVHALRAATHDHIGVSEWLLDGVPDPVMLRQRFVRIRDSRPRLPRPDASGPEPVVLVRPHASDRSTVIEVRCSDNRGTLFRILEALAGLALTVVSARVETIGPQAVDVLCLREPGAGVLTDERAASAASVVRRALTAVGDG